VRPHAERSRPKSKTSFSAWWRKRFGRRWDRAASRLRRTHTHCTSLSTTCAASVRSSPRLSSLRPLSSVRVDASAEASTSAQSNGQMHNLTAKCAPLRQCAFSSPQSSSSSNRTRQ
jgi:hypothetical protein